MKTRDVHFKIEEEEYQRIRREAFEAGRSIGEYIRGKVSEKTLEPAATPIRKSKEQSQSDENRRGA